jgi:uncharacterized protein YbbK (DUF523 family)
MEKVVKPTIVVSRCLGFDICRYDGTEISDEFVEKLKPYVNFVTVCPEVGMGMGVPRDPIRVVLNNDAHKLFQPSTGIEFTDKIKGFSKKILDELNHVDGFILKSKSPSCGISNTKVFDDLYDEEPIAKGSGFFAMEVMKRFPDVILEDEDRLADSKVRKEFLSSIYKSMCDRTNSRFQNKLPFDLNEF